MVVALRSPGRLATAVGVTVAAVAATLMAVAVGQAAPTDGPAVCVDNVRVRSEAKLTASEIGLCRKGTRVTVEQTKDGFVRLKEFHGWAAAQYVQIGSATASTRSPAPGDARRPAQAPAPNRAPVARPAAPAERPSVDDPGADEAADSEPARPGRVPGLLG